MGVLTSRGAARRPPARCRSGPTTRARAVRRAARGGPAGRSCGAGPATSSCRPRARSGSRRAASPRAPPRRAPRAARRPRRAARRARAPRRHATARRRRTRALRSRRTRTAGRSSPRSADRSRRRGSPGRPGSRAWLAAREQRAHVANQLAVHGSTPNDRPDGIGWRVYARAIRAQGDPLPWRRDHDGDAERGGRQDPARLEPADRAPAPLRAGPRAAGWKGDQRGPGAEGARPARARDRPRGRTHGHADRRGADGGGHPQRLRPDPGRVAHLDAARRPRARDVHGDRRVRPRDRAERARDGIGQARVPDARRRDRRVRRQPPARRAGGLVRLGAARGAQGAPADGARLRGRAAAARARRRARSRRAEPARGRGARRLRVPDAGRLRVGDGPDRRTWARAT